MTHPTATSIRTRTSASIVVFIVALFALLSAPIFAQTPAFSESELRDLRTEARSVPTPTWAPIEAFTAQELHDLRTEARTVPTPTWAPLQAFTAEELRDLRTEAHSQAIRSAGLDYAAR